MTITATVCSQFPTYLSLRPQTTSPSTRLLKACLICSIRLDLGWAEPSNALGFWDSRPNMVFNHSRKLSFVTKMLFQVGLLSIFVYFFGIPSVERYASKEVLTVSSEIHSGKIPLPAVTIVAFKSDSLFDWKKVCGGSEDLKSCIRENTRSPSETVHAELGFISRESLMAPNMWMEDFTMQPSGRSFTLLYPNLTGNNWKTDSINLHVNTSDGLTRRFFIHDPEFFVFNINPLGLANNMITHLPRSGRVWYDIALRDHRKLHTPANPCVPDIDYKFTTCVKESLSQKHGCRLPWDFLSDQRRPDTPYLNNWIAPGKQLGAIDGSIIEN